MPDDPALPRTQDRRPDCERAVEAAQVERDTKQTDRDRRAKEMEARPSPIAGISRREFVEWMGLAAAGMAVPPFAQAAPTTKAFRLEPGAIPQPLPIVNLSFTLNGNERSVQVEPRTSLLDLLREHLGLTGTRKGCNQGACGACTVHLDGERIISCLTLAVQAERRDVRTIEGLADADGLHPVQRAFIEHDGFQCGYCTPGQIMSAVALLTEASQPSHATPDVATPPVSFAALSDAELRERMSGNLCRCGAYVGMLAALRSVQAA